MEKENFCAVQRYVDILTEAGFKAVFGEEKNKDVLIDLLNVVLPENRLHSHLERSRGGVERSANKQISPLRTTSSGRNDSPNSHLKRNSNTNTI